MNSNKSHIKAKLNLTEWPSKAVKDIATIVAGGTPSTKISEYWNGDIPWITPKDLSIQRHKYICKGLRNITSDGLNKSSAKIIPSNSVILSTRAPVGYVAISKRNITTNQGCHSLIPNNDLDTEFLYYLVLNNVEYLKSQSNGSTFGELSAKVLSELQFNLPTLKEQKAIAKILSDLDSKIELNEKMNRTLEAIAQAIFKHWFIDFEFPNEEGKPYKSSGGEMVDSELGKIPKGWMVSNIGKELTTVLGGTPSTNKKDYWNGGNIPWINSGKINEFRIINPSAYITPEALKNSATKMMPRGTTVLAITGATLGKVSRIELNMCANQSVIGIIENQLLPSEFVYFWVKSNIDYLISNQTGGAQQHINKENVNELRILIPIKEIMNKYVRMIKVMFDRISLSSFEEDNLSKIRDALLPKLMTGKIRVPLEDEHE